jgi:hypothetical protein
LTLFGINLTLFKLMIFGVVMIMVGIFSFFYFTAPDAKVRVVDVYNLEDELNEFSSGQPRLDVILNFLFHKEVPKPLILHENSKGAFLKVQFKISERELKKLVGEKYENFVMSKKDVVLEGDGEKVYPLFIYEPDKNTPFVKVTYKDPFEKEGDNPAPREKPDDNGPPFEAHKVLVAPSENNPWTHEGVLQIDPSGKSTFKGIRGMIVTYDHGPLPSKEIKITWNEDCHFWMGVKKEEVPAELFLYAWRITCLFPKPESTKNLKLTVLGKKLKMDYP